VGPLRQSDAAEWQKSSILSWTILRPICPSFLEAVDLLSVWLKIVGFGEKRREFMKLVRAGYSVASLGSLLPEFIEMMTAPASKILDRWFGECIGGAMNSDVKESPILKATLSTDSIIGALVSPYSQGSAYVLFHHGCRFVDSRPTLQLWVKQTDHEEFGHTQKAEWVLYLPALLLLPETSVLIFLPTLL
jgi:hypothetical protein